MSRRVRNQQAQAERRAWTVVKVLTVYLRWRALTVEMLVGFILGGMVCGAILRTIL